MMGYCCDRLFDERERQDRLVPVLIKVGVLYLGGQRGGRGDLENVSAFAPCGFRFSHFFAACARSHSGSPSDADCFFSLVDSNGAVRVRYFRQRWRSILTTLQNATLL